MFLNILLVHAAIRKTLGKSDTNDELIVLAHKL